VQNSKGRSYPAVIVYDLSDSDLPDNKKVSPIIYAREEIGDNLISIQCYGDDEDESDLFYDSVPTPTLMNAVRPSISISA
jgi:hypothetical protein